jgi:hypothetical protein
VCNLSNDFEVHVDTCYQEADGGANEKPNALLTGRAFCAPVQQIVSRL